MTVAPPNLGVTKNLKKVVPWEMGNLDYGRGVLFVEGNGKGLLRRVWF